MAGTFEAPLFLLRVQVLVFLRLVQVLGLLRHGTPGEHPLRVMLLPRSSTGLKSGITTLSRSGKSRRGRKATITYSCGSRIRVGFCQELSLRVSGADAHGNCGERALPLVAHRL